MIDKDVILKMVKSFIYNNPHYDNISIEIFSPCAFVSDILIKEMHYAESPTDRPFDMTGDQYVTGTGGYINIWLSIIYDDKKSTIKSEFLRILYTNYLKELREKKISNMGISIADKIKLSLDSYLEFDSSEIFRPDLTRVFGGAIRDIIADMPIQDVDIICASRAAKRLDVILTENGYHYVEGLNPKDLSSIYTDIKVITEPKTYIKGTKIVQIIKPSKYLSEKDEIYAEALDRLISNVDISCCGVSYDGSELTENVKDAILHCRNKVYKVNHSAQMTHRNRINHRIAKFESRGWDRIEGDIISNRDIKIGEILKSESFEDGYYDHIKSWK